MSRAWSLKLPFPVSLDLQHLRDPPEVSCCVVLCLIFLTQTFTLAVLFQGQQRNLRESQDVCFDKDLPIGETPFEVTGDLKTPEFNLFFFAVIVMKCPHFAKKAQPSPGISSVCSLDRFVA